MVDVVTKVVIWSGMGERIENRRIPLKDITI